LVLAEDIGGGDITTLLTVAAGRRARGRLLAKAAGVDLISVGALTHSAPALCIGLDLDISETGQNTPPHGPDSQ
jgi:nicotinate-nucleotide pyrophosphorylase